MDDENSVETEVAPQSEVQQPEVQKDEQESRQARNFRQLRQKQQELENELRLQREMNDRLMQMNQAQKPQEVDELDSVSDDDYIPKGKVKKLLEKEKQRLKAEVSQEIEAVLQKKEQSRFHEKLKSKFSDFDDIVNVDTLALLEEQDPELAQTISDIKDPYKMGIQSYKYIKALNLIPKAGEYRHVKEVEKKIKDSEKAVQSPQAYDKRPMAAAYKLTQAEKDSLYKEMMGYASQAGFG